MHSRNHTGALKTSESIDYRLELEDPGLKSGGEVATTKYRTLENP
jgi:hypothetical protein